MYLAIEKEKNGEQFYYLASLPIKKHFPSLLDDIQIPPHPLEQKKPGSHHSSKNTTLILTLFIGNLWLGDAGQITPVHYDFSTGDPGLFSLLHNIVNHQMFNL
jgi:hypothetical protein